MNEVMTKFDELDSVYPDRKRGKVREVVDLGMDDEGGKVAIIATDQLSAFDWMMKMESGIDGVPDKGLALTQQSNFFFQLLEQRKKMKHHLVETDIDRMIASYPAFEQHRDKLAGRTVIAHKALVVPIEGVWRAYLSGSGKKDYDAKREICGNKLPPGLVESSELPEPIFTPATKAETGHDENISFDVACIEIQKWMGKFGLKGDPVAIAEAMRDKTHEASSTVAAYLRERGLILADTKLEWGFLLGKILDTRGMELRPEDLTLLDEVYTGDSSRIWDAKTHQPGKRSTGFDKQDVRDYLEAVHWDKNSPPPLLPNAVVSATSERYRRGFKIITGRELIA